MRTSAFINATQDLPHSKMPSEANKKWDPYRAIRQGTDIAAHARSPPAREVDSIPGSDIMMAPKTAGSSSPPVSYVLTYWSTCRTVGALERRGDCREMTGALPMVHAETPQAALVEERTWEHPASVEPCPIVTYVQQRRS